MMIDKYGRKVDSLRLSITQRCNLNCLYCHKEGEQNSTGEMSLNIIEKLVITAEKLGYKKIKITGGEPLLRDDIIEIVKLIKKGNFEDISLVTNGLLLEKYAKQLSESGLNRINIGCDSLNSNFLSKNKKNIERGLKAAQDADLYPIKLNMVVLNGINDMEIEQMIEYSRDNNVILQLIELINVDNDFYKKYYFNLDPIENDFVNRAEKIIKRKSNGRKQYDLGNVLVETIRPYHKSFCKNCTKLRITSDGKLKPCLMLNDNLVDFEDQNSFIEAINQRVIFNDRHN